ncbi:MAG: exodeoxyribonuclease V alpha subunit [Kiritimatiellia bacterium]|jgi:exodeoxyribonuclease V alpha subunit
MSGDGTWLEGRLSRVVWTSDDTGYGVVRLRTEKGEVTAVGDLALLADEADADAFVALEGRWEEHSVHGKQFRCTGFLQGLPRTLTGLELYLSQAGIPGVGRATARRIVAHFGVSSVQVLSADPDRLEEVKGIGPEKVRAIKERWSADEEGMALAVQLRGLGLAGRLVDRIRKRYGDEAMHVVGREPYRLAEEISGVGFRTADTLARQQGLPLDDPGRIRAATLYVLDKAQSEGHCFLARDLVCRAVRELGVPVDTLEVAINGLSLDRRVVVEPHEVILGSMPLPHGDDRVWDASMWSAECEVAQWLVGRAEDRRVQEELLQQDAVRSEIARAERYENVELGEGQREAVQSALGGGVVIVTGGPGTGKTTLLKVLLRVVLERGEQWLLASPTGRAARRLEEATGQTSSTLHRLLEYRPGEGGFQRDQRVPLEGDGLVVDEVSMVDLALMTAMLRALPTDKPFGLVLVGDADQLPSVGAGQILRDMIDSRLVPVTRLMRVFRQGQDSGILDAAAAIQDGTVPVSGERSGFDDCYLLERSNPDAAVQTLLKVVAERLPKLGYDPLVDVQVLSPMRRGPLGTNELNKVLQEGLNPDGKPIKRGGKEFRTGDRVICTKNRYDVDVFNGDVGRVVEARSDALVVEFDGRRVAWEWSELNSLELAYAITVHKSQGSEYPAVVLALYNGHSIMLRRNLFYTAVTRAKRFLCVVGNERGWARAVGSVGGDVRHTWLAQRMRELGGTLP